MRYRGSLGAAFIWGNDQLLYFQKKEKDMAISIVNDGEPCMGYVGSNVLMEQGSNGLAITSLEPVANERKQPLRFALAMRRDARKWADVAAKLACREPLTVGTSYPRTAQISLARLGIPMTIAAEHIQSGGIESLPYQYPDLDVIFELVQSGDSLEQNNLTILEDDIVRINLLKIEPSDDVQISYNGGQDGTIDPTL
jgi:ATP phosphoribosyltransferase